MMPARPRPPLQWTTMSEPLRAIGGLYQSTKFGQKPN